MRVSEQLDVVRSRMDAAWVPLLGQPMATRRAVQRFRQSTWLIGLLLLDAVANLVDLPNGPATKNDVASAVVLLVIGGTTYFAPWCYFFTWKVARDIKTALRANGLHVTRRPPLHSRRAFTRWLRRQHLDPNAVVHLLGTTSTLAAPSNKSSK